MLHLIAWSGAKTDSTANEAVPNVADASVSPAGNTTQYFAPFAATMVAAIAYNDTITRARINTPDYRDVGLPEIFPLNALAEPSADYDVCLWGLNGPKLKRGTPVGADVSNGASTVDNATVGLWLLDAFTPIPAGRRFTVRGTSAQTLVANAWTLGGITLDSTLPVGRYGVIGLQCVCNDAMLARLALPNNLSFRPGCPTGETIAINDPRQNFRAGQFGLLGTFDQQAPPQLELLGSTAGAETAAVILDLVELGA